MTATLHRPTRISVTAIHGFPVGDGESEHLNLDDTCTVTIDGDGGRVQVYYPNLAAVQEALEYGVRQCKKLRQNDFDRRPAEETVDA